MNETVEISEQNAKIDMEATGFKCPGCGCPLSSYEIFACRLRGLKKPVCIGCLAGALVFVRKELLPMFDALEQKILDLAEKVPPEVWEREAQKG